MDDRLRDGLRALGVDGGECIAFALAEDPGAGLDWTPWLPFGSLVALMPLPAARQAEYATRYLERHPSPGGWLVEPRAERPWADLHAVLDRRYRVTREADVALWRVTRYEAKETADTLTAAPRAATSP